MIGRSRFLISSWAVLAAGSAMAAIVECPNEPDLATRANGSSVILVGTIARVEDPNHVMPKSPPEAGTTYGGNVRVIFSGREALKGQFHQRIVFYCHQGSPEPTGCLIPRLTPGKLAVIFLSGSSSPFALVGGADGIVYLKPDEVAEFKRSVAGAAGRKP